MNYSVRSAVFARIVKSDVNKHEGMVILKLKLPYSVFQGTENFTDIFKQLKIIFTQFKIIFIDH
jgi:hypothetical protein